MKEIQPFSLKYSKRIKKSDYEKLKQVLRDAGNTEIFYFEDNSYETFKLNGYLNLFTYKNFKVDNNTQGLNSMSYKHFSAIVNNNRQKLLLI